MTTLNLGVLAHVDAGKTSLTERLLHATGAIDRMGRVDDGDTQTDSSALERRRGITIRAAVASFRLGATAVNLIDTPGHPDFIAEVERVLGVLDAVVLVVSAVEGVQAQTRILMRTLQRLRMPTLLFLNKIDRSGADPARVLAEVVDRLSPAALALGRTEAAGTADAHFVPYGAAEAWSGWGETLADHDEGVLGAFVRDEAMPQAELCRVVARQTARAEIHPVLHGSAVTGAGIPELMAVLSRLRPRAAAASGPAAGTVFKIERDPAGRKVAYVRMFDGVLQVRDRPVVAGQPGRDRVTGMEVYDGGPPAPAASVGPGQIARLRGLSRARIGDQVGEPHGAVGRVFPPPSLQTVVTPVDPTRRGALFAALTELAEQDPLIGFSRDETGQVTVALYGEVQREVVEATLAEEYGVAVVCTSTTAICVERPAGRGAAVAYIDVPPNPFLATVGLRVEPAAAGSGLSYDVEPVLRGTMPVAFFTAVAETVPLALGRGPQGWRVTDCRVTLTHTGYYPRQSHAHATFDKSMSSTAGDFRGLTRTVLAEAVQAAGTVVCEPWHRFWVELPLDCLGAVLPALARWRALPDPPEATASRCELTGELPAAAVRPLVAALPGLTRGEGVFESELVRHRPVVADR